MLTGKPSPPVRKILNRWWMTADEKKWLGYDWYREEKLPSSLRLQS